MKQLIITIIAIIIAIASYAAPQVRWLGTTHNFGVFNEADGSVDCEFVFENIGDEPVAIVSTRASCGCTTTNYSAASIAPGQRGSISVSYDPWGRPGRFDKIITVELSYPDSRVRLHLTGTVIASAATVAQRFPIDCGSGLHLARGSVLFGDVVKGRLRTMYVNAYNSSTDTIYPSAETLPPYIEMLAEPDIVPPGEQTSLMFHFRSNRCDLYGLVTDSIFIRPTLDAQPCAIPTVANIKEDFTHLTPGQLGKAPVANLDDMSLDFGRLSRTGQEISLSTNISNSGKSDLHIRRIYTVDSGVSVTISANKVKKGKTAIITVTIDPTALQGALLNARISIISNDPSNPVQILRAVGELR